MGFYDLSSEKFNLRILTMAQRDLRTIEADEIAFFAKYYETEAYNPTGWRLRLQRELRSFRRASKGKRLKRVLSIACGDGQFELMMAPFVEHITALDISPEAIKLAKRHAVQRRITNVDFRCLSISELNWDEQFDAIICLAFLHHVPEFDLPEFLRLVFDHVKPGGLFYSQDPNVHGVLRKIGRLVLRSHYHDYHSPDERELDPQAIAALLRHTGFEVVKLGYIDFTVIPVTYILAKRSGWPLYFCAGIDWLWCHSPFAPWASGFKVVAQKEE
ncbi:methyltransferase domain-containing protein [candidate division KSB1 bacterium]|nr:methyltransferase domain-containing protein [candidate division KSB1 bacterium]